MISIENLPGFVQYVRGSQTSGKTYYGLNVSPNIALEPLDQLDGFLVAKFIQNLFGRQETFFPYIAGVYSALNARSYKDAIKIAQKRKVVEQEKRTLLINVMHNLDINGEVLTTYDLWDDENYWKIVDRLFDEGIYSSVPAEQKISETITLCEFPVEILGKMKNTAKNIPGSIRSSSLYIPLEVAEAVWIRNRYGIEWKIGPPSEDVYDTFIEKEGIGIIRTKQPMGIENGTVKNVMPYIGKTTQPYRILFSDTEDTLPEKCYSENPSFLYLLELFLAYEKVSGSRCFADIEKIKTFISLGEGSN